MGEGGGDSPGLFVEERSKRIGQRKSERYTHPNQYDVFLIIVRLYLRWAGAVGEVMASTGNYARSSSLIWKYTV